MQKRNLVSKNTGEWITVSGAVLAVLREGLGRRMFRENFYVERSSKDDEESEPKEVVEFLRDELSDLNVELRAPARAPKEVSLIARRPTDRRTDHRIIEIRGPSFGEVLFAGLGVIVVVALGRKILGRSPTTL
jgi:hypothetical protein